MVPFFRPGGGTGHLRRCWSLARQFGPQARLYLPPVPGEPSREDAQALFPQAVPVFDPRTPGDPSLTFVLMDLKKTSEQDLKEGARWGTPVLLDEGSRLRRRAPLLIDSLPSVQKSPANQSSPSFLELPPAAREPDPHGPLLVTYGGEDPYGLTLPTLGVLLALDLVDPARITVLQPPLAPPLSLPPQVNREDRPFGLAPRLKDYGLVITSFGLTAYEAAAAGCAVLLINPTAYHHKLARKAGFAVLGIGKPSRSKLARILCHPQALVDSSRRVAASLEPRRNLTELLVSFTPPSPCCAACGELLPPVIQRFPLRSFYRCPVCGITGLYRFLRRENEYGPAYFDQEYRAQYGRSYREDWEALKALAAPRLKIIQSKLKEKGRLLDIGCAYGPFLEAALQQGFSPHGVDVSPQAVDYVVQTLGLPAVQGQFPQVDFPAGFGHSPFDVLTLWYVIEHFEELPGVFKALGQRLRPGGVLAFSTPNGAGISALRSRRKFLEKSPRDHYTIWTPRIARKLLAQYGFRSYCIRVTGHHPERFGLPLKKKGILYRFLGKLSRLFRWGDTFEIYAVKK